MFYTTIDQRSLSAHFQDLTAYHVWAITRLTEWLRQKPVQVMEAKAASSFPGIKATLLHMVEVEREWMGHLELAPDLFQQGLNDDLDSVLDALVEQATALQDYVTSLQEEAFAEICYCNLMLAGEIAVPRKDILQHCLSHGIYHRGQVVTIGHQLGLKDAPMTDYLFYCHKVKKGNGQAGRGSTTRKPESGRERRDPFLAINFFSK
ncbi:DinB family protein [Paraflavitalea sp. CAU 1676]|uniref:DinB family protein n=1 Tax=Paraflavitalea sp. CAU 1676 TaxID=3032598 RepID=UPI0023DA90DA|nr:DinB family protein [Paraflavitalea sp. CAU 1676]MDF2191062.1 DinB family protein [Paraflavitalea sp. CAU 1676]